LRNLGLVGLRRCGLAFLGRLCSALWLRVHNSFFAWSRLCYGKYHIFVFGGFCFMNSFGFFLNIQRKRKKEKTN
jgi:hypothetical protein